jgi:hypothetical protein
VRPSGHGAVDKGNRQHGEHDARDESAGKPTRRLIFFHHLHCPQNFKIRGPGEITLACIFDRHVFDSRTVRPASAGFDDLIDRIAVTCNQRLDAAVPAVAHPTGETTRLSFVCDKGAEPHALDAARYVQAKDFA